MSTCASTELLRTIYRRAHAAGYSLRRIRTVLQTVHRQGMTGDHAIRYIYVQVGVCTMAEARILAGATPAHTDAMTEKKATDFTKLNVGTTVWLDDPMLRSRYRVLVQRLTPTQVIVHHAGLVYRFRRSDGSQVGGRRKIVEYAPADGSK